jgi:predicted peptidase
LCTGKRTTIKGENIMRTLAIVGLALVLAGFVQAGDEKTGFLPKEYKGPEGDAKYVVYVPKSYTGDKAFPAILFLHGSGESGTDGEKQIKVGLASAIKKMKTEFPFIAIFPQSQKGGWAAKSNEGKRAMSILADVEKAYKVDGKRIYLTGLSMGGFGTWSLAAAYPERWAAIAPVCGGGDPSTAAKIKDIPCWCFHGDADKAVPVKKSREMIEALKTAGASPKYTEYPDVGHNSWDRAYGTAELYDWFLMQKLK